MTNERFFFYEDNKKFNSEQEAVDYFIEHAREFYKIEEQIMEIPKFAQNKLWLSNIDVPIKLN